MMDLLLLFSGLILILLAAEGFTNGIEGLGRRLSLSQAVVGSLLAAVGTALPETILPLVAIIFYGGGTANKIGVGAILGAPFMLSTLAFFLVGVTILLSYLKRKREFHLNLEIHSIKRDLSFFVTMYSSVILVSFFLTGRAVSIFMSIFLLGGYVFYVYKTFSSESMEIEHVEGIYLWMLLKKGRMAFSLNPPLIVIILQIWVSLAIMIEGAHLFVRTLEILSLKTGLDPLIFSLSLAPIATELPEKFNSVTWTWKGRDTLAMGNITGAMVFQSTFPVSVGLLFTDWKITSLAFLSAVLAVASALLVLIEIVIKKRVSPLTVLSGGFLYLIYAIVLIVEYL